MESIEEGERKMTGMEGARRRAALLGGLVIVVLLVFAGSARAARYAVAQCGWHIGQDADWADTTGGAKFRPDSFCATPEGDDPFDAAHMKSFTRDGVATVSGTRFARWRWTAPPGTGITAVRGTWWHALHDGLEHRLGAGNASGGFDVFASTSATDTTPREFSAGFSSPQPALESRLLCARGEDKSCSLDPGSFSSVRALTLTLDDGFAPVAAMAGELIAPGWMRGAKTLAYGATDIGSGVRYSQTLVDGATVGVTNYPCNQLTIGGELRATRLQPCGSGALGSLSIGTAQFSDGPHTLRNCAADFAGNFTCAEPRQILIDNNPPAAPKGLAVTGGDGWRRTDDFALSWTNPDQGLASPIAGASYRVTGFDGYDSGVKWVAGDGISAFSGIKVPRPGAYAVQVWLRDAAGNEDPGNTAGEVLRFDDVPPTIAFATSDPVQPELIRAPVGDSLSGVQTGRIEYRRDAGHPWTPLPTDLAPAVAGGYELSAHFPFYDIAPGAYEFRGSVADVAGNTAQTTLRADGTAMTVEVPVKEKTRLISRLTSGRLRGARVVARFGARVTVSGRLLSADGRGIGGREVAVGVRPARGAFEDPQTRLVETGPHGGFHLVLGAGTSRRITVRFRHCHRQPHGSAATSDRAGWFSGWRRADSAVPSRPPG